jgi:hypothetical protein
MGRSLKRGLDRGLQVAVRGLKEISRPVSSRKEKAQVAAISAHNDEATGEMVDAYERAGRKGSSFESRSGLGGSGFHEAVSSFRASSLDKGLVSVTYVTGCRDRNRRTDRCRVVA